MCKKCWYNIFADRRHVRRLFLLLVILWECTNFAQKFYNIVHRIKVSKKSNLYLLKVFKVPNQPVLPDWNIFWSSYLTKVSRIFDKSLGYFEKRHVLSKNCCGYFLGNFWKNWATFYSQIWSHWNRPTNWWCILVEIVSQRSDWGIHTTYLLKTFPNSKFCWNLSKVKETNLAAIFLSIAISVTRKKLPKVYKSCPTMISLEKW